MEVIPAKCSRARPEVRLDTGNQCFAAVSQRLPSLAYDGQYALLKPLKRAILLSIGRISGKAFG
jgi:hypothetical protein